MDGVDIGDELTRNRVEITDRVRDLGIGHHQQARRLTPAGGDLASTDPLERQTLHANISQARVDRRRRFHSDGASRMHQRATPDVHIDGAVVFVLHSGTDEIGELAERDIALVEQIVRGGVGQNQRANRVVEAGDFGGQDVDPFGDGLRLANGGCVKSTDLLVHEPELAGSGFGLLERSTALRDLSRIVGDLVEGRPEGVHTRGQAIVGRFGVDELDPLEVPRLQRQLRRCGPLVERPNFEEFVAIATHPSDIDTITGDETIAEQRRDRTVASRGDVDTLTRVALGPDIGDVVPDRVEPVSLGEQSRESGLQSRDVGHRNLPVRVTGNDREVGARPSRARLHRARRSRRRPGHRRRQRRATWSGRGPAAAALGRSSRST